jgi:hypothetical protein
MLIGKGVENRSLVQKKESGAEHSILNINEWLFV